MPDIRDRIAALYEHRMSELSNQLASGQIELGDYQRTMRAELRDSAAMQLRAALDRDATADDFLKLGNFVKSQDRYLAGFARDIHDGSTSPDAIANRAKMYARSSRTMYWKQYTDGANLPTQPGEQQCLGSCLCEWVDNGDGSWTWDRTNEKGTSCPDCKHNAEIYNPYWPAGAQERMAA